MAGETTFTLQEAIEAQRALRSLIGMTEEVFSVDAFVGMISDEIESSREAGYDGQSISDLIRQTAGKTVTVEEICAFYATPEQRQGHG